VWKPGTTYPASGKSTSLSSTDPTPSVSDANVALHASPGWQPWESPVKTDMRSEGTPHDRVPRTSTTVHPMRCSFRTHLFSRMRFPGLAPWAGMHCPLQGNLQFPGRCPAWYALPRWGNLNNGISIPCPRRGIAYQPRVQTLGIRLEKKPRSEGTPHSRGPRNSTPPSDSIPFFVSPIAFLEVSGLRSHLSAFIPHPFFPGPPYAVFFQNTLHLSDAVPRAMPSAGRRSPVGANGREWLHCMRPLVMPWARDACHAGVAARAASSGLER